MYSGIAISVHFFKRLAFAGKHVFFFYVKFHIYKAVADFTLAIDFISRACVHSQVICIDDSGGRGPFVKTRFHLGAQSRTLYTLGYFQRIDNCAFFFLVLL